MNEFEIIKKYFNWGIGIGDDCAVFSQKHQIITSIDTLIEGVHFFKNAAPSDIAFKSLAVNISDIAAMGGVAEHFTLALTIPKIDKKWLGEFSASLRKTAQKYNVNLIGGDTTKGNLSITISIIGKCEKPIMRSGAKIGDGIFVSGSLGGAALALKDIKNNKTPKDEALIRLNRPTPRLDLGLRLNNIANSCIDISDGLLQDLSHILTLSKVGANIYSDKLPLFPNASLENALNGGDDYELCFTAPVDKIAGINNITQIGIISEKPGLRVDDKEVLIDSYKHFK